MAALTRFSRLAPNAAASTRATLTDTSLPAGCCGKLPFTFMTPGEKRDGIDIVAGAFIKNWKGRGVTGLSNFIKSPVVIDSHDTNKRAVGRGVGLTELPSGDLIGSIEFADTKDGREFYALYDGGFQTSVSISWVCHESKPSPGNSRVMQHIRCELLEISLVTLPADVDARIQGRKLATAARPRGLATTGASFMDLREAVKTEAAKIRARVLVHGLPKSEVDILVSTARSELFERAAKSASLSSTERKQIVALFDQAISEWRR